jgi:hypothetical protein
MAGILNNLCSLAACISFHFVTVSPHQGMGPTHYLVSTFLSTSVGEAHFQFQK